MNRRLFLATVAVTPGLIRAVKFTRTPDSLSLTDVRNTLNSHLDSLLDRQGPYGSYRTAVDGRPDLYSTLDVAQMRAIMGEDLTRTLTDAQRSQWVAHINSFASRYRKDGSYEDTFGHSPLHANGMVIGALSVLGGKQPYPNRLYDPFRKPEDVASWLDRIDWSAQWTASHLFWGGMHCYSLSRQCTADWKDAVFGWLNANLDERTGWWRKGVAHADRHQPLGGSVHILPIYQHHSRVFPYPERLMDSVLALQLPNARWLHSNNVNLMTYLDLDALYALKYMQTLAPVYRRTDVSRAVSRYADEVTRYWQQHRDELFRLHPHYILAAVGTFGLLQHFAPDRFIDTMHWSDIFSDKRFYRTDLVEVLA